MIHPWSKKQGRCNHKILELKLDQLLRNGMDIPLTIDPNNSLGGSSPGDSLVVWVRLREGDPVDVSVPADATISKLKGFVRECLSPDFDGISLAKIKIFSNQGTSHSAHMIYANYSDGLVAVRPGNNVKDILEGNSDENPLVAKVTNQ